MWVTANARPAEDEEDACETANDVEDYEMQKDDDNPVRNRKGGPPNNGTRGCIDRLLSRTEYVSKTPLKLGDGSSEDCDVSGEAPDIDTMSLRYRQDERIWQKRLQQNTSLQSLRKQAY